MTSRRGLPLDPTSADYAWVASVVRAVEGLTRVRSRWNRELYEELNPRIAVRARQDGSMAVSREKVLDPIGKAYRGGGMQTADLRQVRAATLAVTNEAAYHCTSPGDPTATAAHPIGDKADLALQAGLNELWARENVHAVMSGIGMDRIVPEAIGPVGEPVLPSYTAAADVMVSGLSTVSGLDRTAVLNRLQSTGRAQRWVAAADLVIDHRLSGLVPPAHRQEVRLQLTRPLRTGFARLMDPQNTARGTTMAQLGDRVGRTAMSRMTDTADRIAATRYGEQQAGEQQAGSRQAGEPLAGNQAAGEQQSDRRQGPSAAGEPELGKLQRLMEGQGPASGATGRPAGSPDPARPRPAGPAGRSPDGQGRG